MNQMQPPRWRLRFEHLERAYFSLLESQEALENEPENNFIQDSLIQRYEYTIELAWKTMQDYLKEEGFTDVTSPKKVVRKAFQEGLIQDGNAWVQALDDRNRTSHAYQESMAIAVVADIIRNHIPILRNLYFHLQQEDND